MFADHFLYSHNQYGWSSSNIVKRNEVLATLGD